MQRVSAGISALAFNSAGTAVITLSRDRARRTFALDRWSAPDLRPLAATTFRDDATQIALSPDGRFAAALTRTAITLVDATRGAARTRGGPEPASIADLQFSSDGRVLAGVSRGGVVTLWQVRGQRLERLPGPRARSVYRSVAFQAPIAAGDSGASPVPVAAAVPAPAAASAPRRGFLPGPAAAPRPGQWAFRSSAAAAARGRPPGAGRLRFASAGSRCSCSTSPAALAAARPELRGARGRIQPVTQTFLLAVGGITPPRLSDTQRRPVTPPLTGHAGWVDAVAFDPEQQMLASAGGDGTIRLWRVLPTRVGAQGTGQAWGVAFSPDGRRLAVGTTRGWVRLWDVRAFPFGERRAAPLNSFIGHLVFSARGDSVIAAGVRGDVARVAAAGRLQSVTLTTPRRHLLGTVLSPNGRTIATVDRSSRVAIRDLDGTRPVRTLRRGPSFVTTLAFSPDGHRLAVAGDGQNLRVYDVATGRAVLRRSTVQVGFIDALAYGRRYLAVAGDDWTIALTDARTGRPAGVLRGHKGPVIDLAFAADGRMLVSGSDDGTIRLWDARTRHRLAPPIGIGMAAHSVAVSPEGREIAFAGADGSVGLSRGVVWRTDRELRATVCGLVGDGVQRGEWPALVKRPDTAPYQPTC